MVNVTTQSAAPPQTESKQSYGSALAIVTTLFFMWGSLTSLNDVLIPYAQHVFKLKLAASMLIQTAFFSAYFVFSIPSWKIIDWIGYKKAIVVGLLTMVVACLCFYPAAKIPSFPFFLGALIVLATGITILQVAANPYVAVLGNPKTASSRLNLTQAFNSLGTAVFPWIGARIILGTTTSAIAQDTSQEANAIIRLYVYFFAVALFILATGIGLSKLTQIQSAEHHIGQKVDDSIWKHPNLIYGAIGIFVYVGGEVAIGSAIANYLALRILAGLHPKSQIRPLVTMRPWRKRRPIYPFTGLERWSGDSSDLRSCRPSSPASYWRWPQLPRHCWSPFPCLRLAPLPCGRYWQLAYSTQSCSRVFLRWALPNSAR
jgi:FHS family L-fucose permease-like MFS transporter